MTIDSQAFLQYLLKKQTKFITGVPDSLLKDFIETVSISNEKFKHIIAANEGNAVALAAGYYLATQDIPLVYLQNSGIGNIINPILSLSHRNVYSIPMLLMIGWRGEPDKKDEPQHMTQGKITPSLLDIVDIPYFVLDADSCYEDLLDKALRLTSNINSPVAILVKKNSFASAQSPVYNIKSNLPSREEVIGKIVKKLSKNSIVFSTTGMISREYYEYKLKIDKDLGTSFLCVGSMGHASSIAAGFAFSKPESKVVLLDGDGALLMHMGALAANASLENKNMAHILLNNQCHDSVGGQPTCAAHINFSQIATACGFKHVFQLHNVHQLEDLNNILKFDNPFIEIFVSPGHRDNLLRPSTSPLENKENFINSFHKSLDESN